MSKGKKTKRKFSVKNVVKNNSKLIIGMIMGLLWSIGIVYATDNYLFASQEVSYDNTTSGMQSSNVQSALDELYVESSSYQLFEQRVSAIENKLYPVGSIYLSLTDDTVSKVQNKLGGTWEKIGQGRTLIGDGTNDGYTFEAGSTGGETVAGNSSSASQTITNPLGEYTHKLVTAEMPSHTHTELGAKWNPSGLACGNCGYNGGDGGRNTGSAGSNYYHNNIQPYIVVYMYKRTA